MLERAWLVQWDVATAARIHTSATTTGTRIAEIVSDVGSPATMYVTALVAAIIVWRRRSRLEAWMWVGALVGGGVLDQVLKHAVHRARPVGATRFLHIDSFSFPSGHAMLAMVGFGMLALSGGRALARRGREPWPAWSVASVAILAVGASRIYLGVHFPSDVLGGFLAGAAWLTICVTGENVARGRLTLHGNRRPDRSRPPNIDGTTDAPM